VGEPAGGQRRHFLRSGSAKRSKKISQPQIQHTSRRRKQESIVQRELNMNIKRLSVLSVFGLFVEKEEKKMVSFCLVLVVLT